MLSQKLMGMASAPGNIVAALGRPVHMVRERKRTRNRQSGKDMRQRQRHGHRQGEGQRQIHETGKETRET